MILVNGPKITAPTFTLNALANNAFRQSVKLNLGKEFIGELIIRLNVVTHATLAPTNDGTVDLFVSFSQDGTTWDDGVTGADAVWAGEKTANLVAAAALTVSATIAQAVAKTFTVSVLSRYVAFIAQNQTGRALGAAGNTLEIWVNNNQQTVTDRVLVG